MDTFGQPRPNGRTHEGEDIFAPMGSALIAVCDGKISRASNAYGGPNALALYPSNPSGKDEHWYYAHGSSIVGEVPRKVIAGELIGTLGVMGNAKGTNPHLHFGYYRAGIAFNPNPALDRASRVSPKSPSIGGAGFFIGAAIGIGIIAYLAGSK